MKFQRAQGRKEFVGPKPPPSQPGSSAADASSTAPESARGQAVASFYGSLVGTTGRRWVSGGTLQDATAGGSTSSAAAEEPQIAAGAGGLADAAEPSHAGLGSAAARAELAAEQRQLQYSQPAGPLPRDEQAAAAGGGSEQPPHGEAEQQLEEPPQQQQRRQPREGVKYGISRSNVGFQLLKKAGWTEGTGLGAQEQGVVEPLAASQQKGNLGLGYAPKPPPKPKEGTVPAAAGAAAASSQQQQQPRPTRPLPEDPLDKEDTVTKVKRVRQVMQAEADDKAGKAIARYIRMAFNDATGEPTRDSNPLLRRNHKLSATNPLL